MRCVIWILLISFAGILPAKASNEHAGKDVEGLSEAVDGLFADWSDPAAPGGAVVLTDGGQVVLARCYGCADVENGIPVSGDTRFELASVSKQFTAFAVMLLEHEGLLSLEDPIQKHLPELPDYGAPVTVADLLHHTSGLSDWVDVLPYAGRDSRAGFYIDGLMDLVARQRTLEFEPGTKWSYSNTNYGILAEIVARVTGRRFDDWMQENVFGPLDMNGTCAPLDGCRVIPNRAKAYYYNADGDLVRFLTEDFGIPGPAHVFASIDDMARWMDNLRTGRVGGRELVSAMMARTTLKTGEESFYGAGLGMGEYRGVQTVGHSGQTGAFKSELIYCPEIGVGVVVLANARAMPVARLSREVLDLYLGDRLSPRAAESKEETPVEEAEPFAVDPSAYEPYLGGYRLEADPAMLVGVSKEGERLVGVLVGEGLSFFSPTGPGQFRNTSGSCELSFAMEAGHPQAQRVVIKLYGQDMEAVRSPLPADSSWMDDLPGRYYCDEMPVAYEVALEGEDLLVRQGHFAERPVEPIDEDVLAGGIGVLEFLRDGNGRITGFDFSEPEDFGARLFRFERCGVGD